MKLPLQEGFTPERQLTAVATSRGTRPSHCLLYAGEPVHRTASSCTGVLQYAPTDSCYSLRSALNKLELM